MTNKEKYLHFTAFEMKKKISVFTLGCKTNLYESRQLISALLDKGFDAEEGLKKADIYIINTCAVTNEAERKSRQAVARCKKLNPDARILVCGCASQRDFNQFGEDVSFVSGTAGKLELIKMLDLEDRRLEPFPKKYPEREFFAAHCKTRDFIKIQDGCDNFCSYCIIPYMRGRSRSRALDDIAAEAKNSVAKEIVLTGIDISSYGKDTDSTLAELCRSLKGVSARKRLGSLEVNVISDALLDAMEESDFCPHFHLSLQSGSADVLKAMNRHYTPDEYMRAVEKIRGRFSLAGITTDVIVAFPTETEKNFAETMDFCREVGFSDIHVFPYSAREGTVAARMKRIDSRMADERVDALTSLKAKLKEEFLKKNLGRTEEVLTEERGGGYVSGYTPNYIKVYVKEPCETDCMLKVRLGGVVFDGLAGEEKI